MMICKPEFEELFPDMLKPEQCQVTAPSAPEPRTPCFDRWEDDGGRTLPKISEVKRNVPRVTEYLQEQQYQRFPGIEFLYSLKTSVKPSHEVASA